MQCCELLLISLKFFTISYHSLPSSTETSKTRLIDLTEVGVNLMDTVVCPNGCISPLDGIKVNSLTAYKDHIVNYCIQEKTSSQFVIFKYISKT